jgi:hypothetical protein
MRDIGEMTSEGRNRLPTLIFLVCESVCSCSATRTRQRLSWPELYVSAKGSGRGGELWV